MASSTSDELERNQFLHRELNRLRAAVAEHPTLSKTYFIQECASLIGKSPVFCKCSEKTLLDLARLTRRVTFEPGDILLQHEQTHKYAFFIAEGEVFRQREVEKGQGVLVEMDYGTVQNVIGGLGFWYQEQARSHAVARNTVVAYRLDIDDVTAYLKSHPEASLQIISSLSVSLQSAQKPVIPLLAQRRQASAPIMVVAAAAACESFYRSALNALLNHALATAASGQTQSPITLAKLFPNMHIQMPTRVLYINGLKQIRFLLDDNIDAAKFSYPFLAQLIVAVAPGVTMTPMSSLLEANNAGHSNPEPLLRRAMRGYSFRTVREVVFGIGLNQLSDFCEDRMTFIENKAARNAAGSLTAGVCSGYLSHVPHNLSTMKMLDPSKTYMQHFHAFANNYEKKMALEVAIPDVRMRKMVSSIMCVVFPTGITIRVTQIVGTFCIINGIVAMHRRVYGGVEK